MLASRFGLKVALALTDPGPPRFQTSESIRAIPTRPTPSTSTERLRANLQASEVDIVRSNPMLFLEGVTLGLGRTISPSTLTWGTVASNGRSNLTTGSKVSKFRRLSHAPGLDMLLWPISLPYPESDSWVTGGAILAAVGVPPTTQGYEFAPVTDDPTAGGNEERLRCKPRLIAVTSGGARVKTGRGEGKTSAAEGECDLDEADDVVEAVMGGRDRGCGWLLLLRAAFTPSGDRMGRRGCV